jgi:hypothetical protein
MGGIREIHKWNIGTVHLLVTSREQRDVEDAMKQLLASEVRMRSELVDEDIKIFVHRRIRQDAVMRGCEWPEDVLEGIEMKLTFKGVWMIS